jgi:hypothetical protein
MSDLLTAVIDAHGGLDRSTIISVSETGYRSR